MKKTALFLAIMLVMSLFTLASCGLIWGNKECTEHVDANGDYTCDNCGDKLDPPTPECTEHADADGNLVCDNCGTELADDTCTHTDANNDHVCDVCGEANISECADENKDHKCDVCGTEIGEHKSAEGGHNCEYCGDLVSECTDADGDYVCDICGEEKLPDHLERVSYYLNISDLEAGMRDADDINSKFTIISGTEVRNRTKTFEGVEYTKSVKIGSNNALIKVSVPGTGKLSFLIQNGSSGAATQFVKITDPDGNTQEIEFSGTNNSSPVEKITIDVTAGEWTIGRVSGTIDIFELDLSCIVEKSDESGFEIVSEGTVDYLCGQQLDFSGLNLNAVYANGKTEPLALENVTVDSSAVDMTKSGIYEIKISYKEYDVLTYNVSVYEPESVELGVDAVEKLASGTSAGNGVYFNYSLKEVYAVGEAFDSKGLSVLVKGTLGEVSKTFSVDGYAISELDTSTAGTKTLTVSYIYSDNSVSTTIGVHVVDTAPSIVDEVYQVKVDADYSGVIGAVEDGYNMFTTIQQALDFLADSEAGKKKLIAIEPGYYQEKLEITIPNLTIKGAGADEVIIEWDSLYGLKDAGGFTHTTDSTQTVAVREQAVNCLIEGVTISNYWNSQERMDEAGLAIERGLALLVQADKFIMKDSSLLGIQDTLELFTGRQYFENVFISGYTDFIFGTNNTTLFKNCTIHVIDTVKDDQGTAGYLTAFKGSNKGAADAIVYGAIFDGCKFTADEGVMAGKTAIGRTWGAYAAVAIINSELGEHISIDGYDSSNNKNKRYISMNGVHPTDDTVQFVEFGNTGAGAITEAVAGMRMLTADEAALYTDIKVIFGTINGGVSYLDPWDPAVTEIVEDDRTYYYFDQTVGASGESHTFDTTTTIASGSTLEWEGLLISAENGKVAWNSNANALNMKQGAFIKFSVKAGTSVAVETYPNYNYFTLNGVGTASANILTQYYAEDTEVVLMSTGDLYIYQIIINPGEEAPAAPTLNEIKVSGMNVNYVVGDEISLEGVVVKAYYSDNSVVEVKYEVDSSKVVNTAAGKYEVVFSYGEMSATVSVIYEDPNAGPEISKTTVLDFSTVDGLEAVQNNPKVTVEGSVRHNGAEIQITGTISFMVKAGTRVIVTPYANTNYASYTIGAEGTEGLETLNSASTFVATEDCTVVYTGLSNNYLVSINILCPAGDETYVFGSSNSTEGDYTNVEASVGNLVINGQIGNNGDSIQLKQNTTLEFIAPAFATVTITGHSTGYGQLVVYADDTLIEMDANACYVFSTLEPVAVKISCKNVGTEDSPAYNKSYIKAISVSVMNVIDETVNVSFGSNGNYKDSVIDFSGITIGDNSGNNSQIKNGSFSFAVKAGATVTVNGYPSYTSYNFSDGITTVEGITDTTYTYTAENNVIITISHTEGNNYFYSIDIKYPAAKESFIVTFGSDGNYHDAPDAIDLSGVQIGDNGGDNSQVKNGSITVTLYAGGELTINGYDGYTDYTISNGGALNVTVTDSVYLLETVADTVITITPNSGNNYFYSIVVEY